MLGMCNWVAWWFNPEGRDGVDAVAGQLTEMALGALQRTGDRAVDGGPAAALAMLRQDIDHLERTLDL